jgi:hypothetical protein
MPALERGELHASFVFHFLRAIKARSKLFVTEG